MKGYLKLLLLLTSALAVLGGCELEKDPSATPPPQPTPPPDVRSEGQTSPSPDRLVFSSGRDEPDLEVYVSFTDGSGRTRVTRNLDGDSGAVAYPNTGLVYYVCGRSESVCVGTTSGTGAAGVMSSQRIGFPIIEDPAISPDGSRMLFTGVHISPDGKTTNYDLYLYDFATEEITNFAVGAAQDQMASWASDDTVVWSRLRQGDWDLVTFRIGAPRGSSPTVLTNNDVDDLGVDVSPDGSKVAWIAAGRGDQRNAGELMTMPFTGAAGTATSIEPVHLERGFIGGDPDTAWSPDGTRIAFAGLAPGEEDVEIFTIPATDGAVTNVTRNDIYDVDPEWAQLPPSVSVSTPPVATEGTSASVVFEIRLDAPQTQLVTVDYATVAGTATAADFTPRSGTARFEPGQTRVTVDVPITNDTLLETMESFRLRLSNTSAGTLTANDEATGRIADDEVEPTPTPRPATPSPTPSASPPPAGVTDGRIAFASDRSGTNQIYTMTSSGGDVRHVSPDQASSGLGSPTWSQDATRLIHTALNSSGGSPQPEIVDRPSDGTGGFRLLQVTPAIDNDPAYLPGDALGGFAFASDRGGDFDIYYATPAGGSTKTLTDNTATDGHPSFSTASGGTTRMVFHSNADGDYDVYMVNVSTSGDPSGTPVNLTQEAAGAPKSDELAPDFALGKNAITYHGNEHGDFDIYMLDLATMLETHLTTDVANETNPAFSPTGNFITFQRDLGGGNTDVFVMPAQAGAAPTNLTSMPGIDHTPDWGAGAAPSSPAASPAAVALVVGAPVFVGLSLVRRRRRRV